MSEGDDWREPEVEAEYLETVPGAELFLYPGPGHLVAEPGHPDFDEESARLATTRVVAFLASRSG